MMVRMARVRMAGPMTVRVVMSVIVRVRGVRMIMRHAAFLCAPIRNIK
jgi:hypothetical protein